LDQSVAAVKLYTGHLLSSVGWGTHALADAGKLRSFPSSQTFSMQNIEDAYELVAAGSLGKVVVSAD
jgi:hypothetical protein